jgi:mono/diheme cytochrome c family protein
LIGVIVLTLSSVFVASCALGPSGGMTEEWEAPARAAGIRNPVAADTKSVAAGELLYQQNCLACHGTMGKGNGRAATSLEPSPADLSMPMMWEHSDGALFWKITEGRRPMPAFETLLADEQRWQVVNYVRTLAARPDVARVHEESKDMAPMGSMR